MQISARNSLKGKIKSIETGAVNPRWFYGPLDPTTAREARFSDALGAEHLTDLDVDHGRRRIERTVVTQDRMEAR